MNNCPCGSKVELEKCCLPFIKKVVIPINALQLMQSRYTAYVLKDINYIIETTVFKNRIFLKKRELIEWVNSVNWINLEIVNVTETVVEFKATFIDVEGKMAVHHEKSSFKRVKDKWYYVDGVYE